MTGTTMLVMTIGILIVLGLAIKVAVLRARLEGQYEAYRQMANGHPANRAGIGCLQLLAVIGFIAICALCIYLGMAAAAME